MGEDERVSGPVSILAVACPQVIEVDVDPLYLDHKLRQGIEGRLRGWPIIVIAPVIAQLREIARRGAVFPVCVIIGGIADMGIGHPAGDPVQPGLGHI